MIATDPTMQDFIHQQAQSPLAVLMVQTATNDGSKAATQTVLGKIISYQITRNEDPSSNTAQIMITDDLAEYLSTNPNAAYSALFQPGVIDNKFIVYLGFEGSTFANSPAQFQPYTRELIQKFTGFLETDANQQQTFMINKTISLIDLTKQFRFPVNDTFPHPLYGDQTLSFFDPDYNLVPINASGGTATEWQCKGRMFCLSAGDLVYGSAFIPINVYVDTTGGSSPQNTATNPANYFFDYSNGIVTFTSAIPVGSVVSLAGTPTYMAPEEMIKLILVNLASWSPDFLNLDASNILIPQFVANGLSVWECVKQIAGQCAPRFIPWQIYADENGNLNFYESRVDGPPVRTFLQGKDLLINNYSNDARQLRTVVRADGIVFVNNGGLTASDQPIVSIAYDLQNIYKYGQTEPLELSQNVTQNVRPLPQTEALSYLNMMTAATLAKVSRPRLTLTAQIWPDPSLQPGDKVAIQDDSIGMDKQYILKTKVEAGQGKLTTDTLTLEEFYDTINYSIGVPSGVSTSLAQAATTPPPSLAIIGGVRMGSGAHVTYPLLNGNFTTLPNGDQLIPKWYVSDGPMNFDYYLNSLPLDAATTLANPQNQWDYYHLPAGYGFTAATDAQGNLVYYGIDPLNSYTVYVGPDSVFYTFNHAAPATSSDLITANIWIPPGNVAPLGAGGTQLYTGTTTDVFTWSMWYAGLDGSGGSGKFFRPLQRVNPSQDGVANAITATGGLWVMNQWTNPPGPTSASTYYGNLVLLNDNHYTPAPGFVGANVLGDGVLVGCSYGETVAPNTTYVNYQKSTRAYYRIVAANSNGQRQAICLPFDIII